MKKREVITIIKKDIKVLVAEIRLGKFARKPKNRNSENESPLYRLEGNRYEVRHLHIAYCEFRGRSRDIIEQPAEGNEPNEFKIDNLLKKWNGMLTVESVAS